MGPAPTAAKGKPAAPMTPPGQMGARDEVRTNDPGGWDFGPYPITPLAPDRQGQRFIEEESCPDE
ncbi:hypothetical protein [Mycobacterium stomatepiae]|uniref:Uncharacterized protein n=1 Tax=Mycobacterium stomatepiae TaxID=470076 RepID=A0A7I7Q960_9MYCO|nr:hypothetical protein [Mycobacterium stomatepiae]MCV7164510.1 hypothetical protein [Mycobacterium stomatepiae]BBY22858.1 hypothetical protein MSTO_30630 [Mycobacterium stomatepiae]